MNRNTRWLIAFILFFMFAVVAEAQKKTQKPVKKTTQGTQKKTKAPEKETDASKPADVQAEEQKVRDIIAFLQYVLNTLGSSETSSRDKDVLITQSYSKIFRDEKVQVEDDLDDERKVITNKDIVAYLKDVDFFFHNIKFEFTIEDIKQSTMANGQLFYKVTLTRNIQGTNAEGQPVNNTIPRYVEINYNPEDQDLKIVSIYTNEFDETEALTNWWKELSYEWQAIFKKKLNIQEDSLAINDLKDITAIEELDLSNNQYIQNIEPLAQLHDLKLLNLAETNIGDLTPIRNLTELVELNLSNTKIFDLTPLKYAAKLERLNINDTEVRSVAVLENMPQLKNFEMRATHVIDFDPVAALTGLINLNLGKTQLSDLSPVENLLQLMELDVTSTKIEDVSQLKALKNLISLNIDSTAVKDISPLSTAENLEVLSANHTLISTLNPLQKLAHLEKVYCDQTPIKREQADAFMVLNPKVLVVYDSKDLQTWWTSLPLEWQNQFSTVTGTEATPDKEALAKITNLDSINFSGIGSINDLEPLRRLQKLTVVVASKTSIRDLTPLADHREIRYLDISQTGVNDLSILSSFNKLSVLRADQTEIESIEPLYNIAALEELYVDQTFVHDIVARELLDKNPGCLVVFKTVHLNRWWTNLPENWKEVFWDLMGNDTSSTRENLHKLVEKENLSFRDTPVRDLSALSEFVRLKALHFSATAINNIPAMDNLRSLKSLHAANSPIRQIESLREFTELEDLDISSTPVDELKALANLKNLKNLNCGGTQIKKIDPLEDLENLESFDCSNTRVKNLDALEKLPLKTLKCYNTKVSPRNVEKFKEGNPDCRVIYYR